MDEKDRKLALQKVKLEKLEQEIEKVAQLESKFQNKKRTFEVYQGKKSQ